MQFPEKRKGRNPDKQKKEEENLINRRKKRRPPRTYNIKKGKRRSNQATCIALNSSLLLGPVCIPKLLKILCRAEILKRPRNKIQDYVVGFLLMTSNYVKLGLVHQN